MLLLNTKKNLCHTGRWWHNINMSVSALIVLFVYVSLCIFNNNNVFVHGSIQEIDTILYPDIDIVQYTDSYIRGPGVVDLSQLTFTAISPPNIALELYGGFDDEYSNPNIQDDFIENELDGGDNDSAGKGDATGDDKMIDDELSLGSGEQDGNGNGNRRRLQQQQQQSQLFIVNQTQNEQEQSLLLLQQQQQQQQQKYRQLAAASATATIPPTEAMDRKVNTTIDIVVFSLSSKCVKDEEHCDWSSLGVGKKSTSTSNNKYDTSSNKLHWCCDSTLVDEEICTENNIGRLIIDNTIFTGQHISISIPYDGYTTSINVNDDTNNESIITEGTGTDIQSNLLVQEDNSATYVVLFSNCNNIYGRQISIDGTISFFSKHGYLPGELYGFMYFYFIITILYCILFFYYSILMNIYNLYRIPIEKYILITIVLGCTEMIFRSIDYIIWNKYGYRLMSIVWTSFAAGILKQGFSRCLLLMVCMGWGVICDMLGRSLYIVLIVGLMYIIVLSSLDATVLVAANEISTATSMEEKRLFSTTIFLQSLLYAIDTIIFIWIINSLYKTIVYLQQQKNQYLKLKRFTNVCYIVLISYSIVGIKFIISTIDHRNDESIIQEEFAWLLDALSETNYLFVLVSIALLWRPNPTAREYAYAMELQTTDDDDNCDSNNNTSNNNNGLYGNDLELTTMDSVPSAIDDDNDNYNETKYGNSRHTIT